MPFPTPSQGGVRFWQYEQSSPASTWTIFHGFGEKPLVDIIVLDGGIPKKAFPFKVEHIDDNSVEIVWTTPRTGYVSFASTMS